MNAVSKIEVAEAAVEPQGLALLRKPFAAHHVSKLPKESRKQADERKAGQNAINCNVCGGWHHKNAVHLDYVGHAALTDRLLDTDIEWSWEPVAFNERGLPALDATGGMWIKLTVLGVTRLGYGAADGKTGGDAIKEIIGDALRNAAMRFGAALDLWHKGDLHAEDGDDEKSPPADDSSQRGRVRQPLAVTAAQTAITSANTRAELSAWKKANEAVLADLPGEQADEIIRAFKVRWAAVAPASEIASDAGEGFRPRADRSVSRGDRDVSRTDPFDDAIPF